MKRFELRYFVANNLTSQEKRPHIYSWESRIQRFAEFISPSKYLVGRAAYSGSLETTSTRL